MTLSNAFAHILTHILWLRQLKAWCFAIYIYLLLGLYISMFIICHFMCLPHLISTPTIVYWVFEVSFFNIYVSQFLSSFQSSLIQFYFKEPLSDEGLQTDQASVLLSFWSSLFFPLMAVLCCISLLLPHFPLPFSLSFHCLFLFGLRFRKDSHNKETM